MAGQNAKYNRTLPDKIHKERGHMNSSFVRSRLAEAATEKLENLKREREEDGAASKVDIELRRARLDAAVKTYDCNRKMQEIEIMDKKEEVAHRTIMHELEIMHVEEFQN